MTMGSSRVECGQQSRADLFGAQNLSTAPLRELLRRNLAGKSWQIAIAHGSQSRRTMHVMGLVCRCPDAGGGIRDISGGNVSCMATWAVTLNGLPIEMQAQRRIEEMRVAIRENQLRCPIARARRVHAANGAARIKRHRARGQQRQA